MGDILARIAMDRWGPGFSLKSKHLIIALSVHRQGEAWVNVTVLPSHWVANTMPCEDHLDMSLDSQIFIFDEESRCSLPLIIYLLNKTYGET
jgi:hypothetical protein